MMLGGGWSWSKIGECCPGGLRDLHEMDLGIILMVTIGLFGLKKKISRVVISRLLFLSSECQIAGALTAESEALFLV